MLQYQHKYQFNHIEWKCSNQRKPCYRFYNSLIGTTFWQWTLPTYHSILGFLSKHYLSFCCHTKLVFINWVNAQSLLLRRPARLQGRHPCWVEDAKIIPFVISIVAVWNRLHHEEQVLLWLLPLVPPDMVLILHPTSQKISVSSAGICPLLRNLKHQFSLEFYPNRLFEVHFGHSHYRIVYQINSLFNLIDIHPFQYVINIDTLDNPINIYHINNRIHHDTT